MKGIVLAIALALVAVPAFAQDGNGAPSGPHYNLNILGKENCAGADLKGSNRHTIQVMLWFDDLSQDGILYSDLDKRNKIFLAEGEFKVLDGNACDRDGAKFQLPANPFECNDEVCAEPTFMNYTVWARALGKPGGEADITTCAVGAGEDGVLETADDEVVCSTESVLLVRTRGQNKFQNYTKELTTIYADIDDDGNMERVGLFEDMFYDYFWDYDNRGLRLAQLRFYPIAQ